MKHSLFTTRCMVTLFVIAFAASSFSFAQKASKQRVDPKRTTLEQLHPPLVESEPPKGISLLIGYKHRSGTDFEGNNVGEVLKAGGLKIRYEIGFSQGEAVESSQKNKYLWYREQSINGRIVKYALNRSRTLIITIPLDATPNTWHAANFYGEIKRPEDIADMLLMVLPFAYQ